MPTYVDGESPPQLRGLRLADRVRTVLGIPRKNEPVLS